MKKKYLINLNRILGVLVKSMMIVSISTVSSLSTNKTSNNTNLSEKSTHTVLVEVATSQGCGPCDGWNTNIYNQYISGTYDFEYVEMIVYDHSWDILNMEAYRWKNIYGITSYPTSVLDGGYRTIVGNDPGSLPGYLSACENRAVADIIADLEVRWLGDSTMNIEIDIQNNEGTQYNGHIRAYITEIVSRYDTAGGQDYHNGFLDFAFDEDISINPGGSYTDSVTWNGNDHSDEHGNDYGDIAIDNIRIILGVFDDNGYVDETVAATPVLDSGPPEISNANANPSIQFSGGTVELSADVVDDSAVNQVNVIISDPVITIYNETMTLDTGDKYSYNSVFTTTGLYNYYIWAEDVNGNQNTSETYTFEIMNPHVTDLSSKWNFISLNLNQSMSKTDLIVNYNGFDYTWDDAVSLGYINDIIFGWDRPGQYYTFADTFEPGYAYWGFAYSDCIISE